MIRAIKRAYGAGYRGGMTPRATRRNPDGTKHLVEPRNPYTGRFQFFERLAYEQGVHAGTMRSLQDWLTGRRKAV